VVPNGLVVTEATLPRTSTSLPTYWMASDSFITIGFSPGAAIVQRSRVRIVMKRQIRIAKAYILDFDCLLHDNIDSRQLHQLHFSGLLLMVINWFL
jgi:hypothetical protein